ncbi:hypothetical protein Gogos_009028, partial [Gossypium gossypioides]|nr:hypothetical protein [Gossypium gossypioides]
MKWLRRGIGEHGSCSLYWHGNEDLIHVIRDCPVAREVWFHVVLVELQSMFFCRGNSPEHFETTYESSMTGNWIQLYIDGTVKMDAGFAFSMLNSGGILHGLILIQRKGYKRVVIHTNNLEVVKAIQDAHLADSSS